MPDRIDQLKAFVDEDPDDPFNRYALALEYRKVDLPQAIALFKQLAASQPAYVPTYYQLAKALEETGDLTGAHRVYEDGIRVAGASGDRKALNELVSARDELLDELN